MRGGTPHLHGEKGGRAVLGEPLIRYPVIPLTRYPGQMIGRATSFSRKGRKSRKGVFNTKDAGARRDAAPPKNGGASRPGKVALLL